MSAKRKGKTPPLAPAVQGGELWGGPRVMTEFTGEPILVRTKRQYFALLRKHGLRMEHQQESTTGDGPKGDAFVAPKPQPIVVAPMTQDEAHLFGAVGAFYRRYGLKESLTCSNCFARQRDSGMRLIVSNRRVRLECRCGVAEYVAPTGTTDLVLNTLATSAITMNDRTGGTVRTDIGQINVPTFVLHDMESVLLRRYLGALRARGIEPHLFHAGTGAGQGCWHRNPRNFTDEVGLHATRDEVVVTCPCRTLFWRRRVAQSPVLH